MVKSEKPSMDDLHRRPLWVIICNGLEVRNEKLDFYFPKLRSHSGTSAENLYNENILAVKAQYRFTAGKRDSIDLVLFLNGLPIIAIELKHEDEKQNVHDAASQYGLRPQENAMRGRRWWRQQSTTKGKLPEVMDELRNVFQITDAEAILINTVIEKLLEDSVLVGNIHANAHNPLFMNGYREVIRQRAISYYFDHNWGERLMEGPFRRRHLPDIR